MCHAACVLSTTTHIITTTTNNTNDYYKATTATKRHSLLTIYNHYHVQMPSANLVARAQHHLSCAGGNPLGLAGGGPKKSVHSLYSRETKPKLTCANTITGHALAAIPSAWLGGSKKKGVHSLYSGNRNGTDLREHHHLSCAGGNPLGLAVGVQKKKVCIHYIRATEMELTCAHNIAFMRWRQSPGPGRGGPKTSVHSCYSRDKAETDLRAQHHLSCAGGNPLGLAGRSETNTQTNTRTNERTNEQTNKQTNKQTHEQTHGRQRDHHTQQHKQTHQCDECAKCEPPSSLLIRKHPRRKRRPSMLTAAAGAGDETENFFNIGGRRQEQPPGNITQRKYF